MKTIQKEQILRVNCPGFGEENYFTVGKAKALDAYTVIIVNPVSVFHLFDKDLALQKEIDLKLADGLTNLTIASDTILQSIQDDLKSKRILELVSFLEKGGLLIYYLCRPFLVQGDNIAIDNYSWLESLAPDSSPDDNIRHMSAVSHGRIVEPTEHTDESGFGKYFAQTGLEWNTIIRTDFLTEGYIALATAGPRKCIAGQLVAGDQGGRIVFLPAPFSPDFDKTLVECINVWYNAGGTADAAPVVATPAPAATAPAAESPRTSTTSAPTVPAAESPRTFTTQANAVSDPARTSSTAVPTVPEASPRTSTTSAPLVTPPATGLERVPSQFTSVSQNRLPAAKVPDPLPPHANPSTAATSTTLPSMVQGTLAEPTAAKDPLNSLATAEFDAESVRAFLNSDQAVTAELGQEALPAAAEKSQPAADTKPSAVDILKELEALSMSGDTQPAQPAAEAKPAKPSEPAAALSRNLFEELETLAQTPTDKPAEPAAPAAPPALEVKAAVPESKELNAHLNQMAESLSAQADAKRAAEPPKAEAPSAPPAAAAAPTPPPAPAATPPAPPPLSAPVPPPPRPAEPIAPAAKDSNSNAGDNNFTPDQNFDSNFQFESEFNFNDLEKEFAPRPAKEQEQENHKDDTAAVPATPEAKDLIKKMEEISKTMAAPDWAVDITFPDVEELKKERIALTESIKQAQTKIASIDNKIAQLEALKNALLGAEGEDLNNASVRVFNRLGWNAAPSGKSADEYHLSGGGKADFIAKVVKSATQAQRSDLSSLASSVVEFWDKNEVEPKGILVACTWASKAPTERTEPDFAEGLAEFAQKKGLCLMTTTQLLCIYRDIEMGKQSTDEIRKRIEETNGRLLGFQLSAPMAKV